MSRDEILRRRARFVSAALMLTTGCSREPARTDAKAVPSTEAKAVASTPEPPRPTPPVKPPADRPTFAITVSTAGEAKRAAAAASIEKIHAGIEELAGAIPIGCLLVEPTCRARFKVFATDVARLREDIYRLSPPHCPPKAADDKAVEAMLHAHRAWLGQWLDKVEDAGRAAAAAQGDAGSAWDELHAEAAKAYAHPCLSLVCP
ncbi:MAG: hypothetical protein HYV09_22160 [Deltaproteobacteria bacterium]|nr:hypothetical protein [Deltaproteobacteria bacterium]